MQLSPPMKQLLSAVAAVAFGISLVAHAITFTGSNLTFLFPWIWLLHIGIFPLLFFVVRTSQAASQEQQPSLETLATPIPHYIKIVLLAFFIYAIINFVIFISLTEGGTPSLENGIYVLKNRGTFIRQLTESEYLQHQAYTLRGFSGHWLIFYLLPAVYFRYHSK